MVHSSALCRSVATKTREAIQSIFRANHDAIIQHRFHLEAKSTRKELELAERRLRWSESRLLKLQYMTHGKELFHLGLYTY